MFWQFQFAFAAVKVVQTDGTEVLSKDSGKSIKVQPQTNQLIINFPNLKSCHIKGAELVSFKTTKQNRDSVCEIEIPLETKIPFTSTVELIVVGDSTETVELQDFASKIASLSSDIEEEPFTKLNEIEHVFGGEEERGNWFATGAISAAIVIVPWLYLVFQAQKVRYRIYGSGLLFLASIACHFFINFNFWFHGSLFSTLFQHFVLGIATILFGHKALVERIKLHHQ
eukprot:NODE_191_length_13422_cov_1.451025.p6 type:complete len:227 gc:universal NODE_191_length_13422_cov_1.451025:784-1464(+)